MNRLLFSILAVILLSGCHSVPPPSPAHGELLQETILVIPPVQSTTRALAASDELGRTVYLAVANVWQARVLHATDIAPLHPFLTWQNLGRNGTLSHQEVAAMGRLANCSSAIGIHLLSSVHVPPQAISLQAVWVRSSDAAILGEALIDLRLDRELDRHAFEAMIVDHLKDGKSRDLAAFSPILFRQFAARCTVEALLAPKGIIANH